MDIRFLIVMQVLLMLFVHTSHVVAVNGEFGNVSIICKETQRKALLSLKHDFTFQYYEGYPVDTLPSWKSGENHKECCKWEGVTCNNQTGYVVELDLHDYRIKGTISPSLVQLHHLIYLDLSGNNFSMSPLPKFIGSLTHLKYLSLSNSIFSGKIPYEWGNLCHLEHLDVGGNTLDGEFPPHLYNLSKLVNLDLAWNYFTGKIPYYIANLTRLQYLDLSSAEGEVTTYPFYMPSQSFMLRSDLEWVFRLKFLKALNLYNVDLSSAHNWLQKVSNLSHLQELYLGNSNLSDSVSWSLKSSVTIISTILAYVDLSSNRLTSSTALKFFLDVCSLRELHLSLNKLSGRLDDFIPTTTHCANKPLEVLTLYGNRFTGSIPDLSAFPSLTILVLDYNSLNETVSKSIWELSNLTMLTVSHNSLQGVISEAQLSKLSKLLQLDLSFNAFMVDLSSEWIPPFQLDELGLASCNLGPHFPRWLRTQRGLLMLDISSNEIIDPIPNWVWHLPNTTGSIAYLNLSHNRFSGHMASLTSSPSIIFQSLDLSYNMLQGQIPSFLSMSIRLDLSNNKFSEASSFICSKNTYFLSFLDLSSNQLSGMLSDCWTSFERLTFLNLENNNFSGNIPSSIGFLTNMKSLHLGNNNFMGEIPLSLNNCRELRVLDVVKNSLSGPVPSWIGDGLQKIQVLTLRSNKFHGTLPSNICHLPEVLLLDLSFNNISGSIPKCFNKLTTLASQSNSSIIANQYREFFVAPYFFLMPYSDSESLMWKGKVTNYHNTLGLMRSIDLSSNSFIGEIPNELMSLTGLISLNISRNRLSGEIPSTIGQLKFLDALDLSRNNLSGKIPIEFSKLGLLSALDLSYNNFFGEIPDVTTLQSFEASTYIGNPRLCGSPLSKCPMNQTNHDDGENENEKHNFILEFYISMILGFIVGFWGVCGTLVLKKSWRYTYFKFFDDLYGKLYVLFAISKAHLQRRIRTML